MANPNPDEIALSDEDILDAGDYEVAHDPTMAAALGFTSFGAQDDSSRPSKKRRFNPQSDAAVVATGPFTAHKAQQRQRAKSKSKAQSKSTPKDEITYSSSDDNDAKNNHGNNNDDDDDDDDFDLDTAADLEDPPNPSLPIPNLSLPARPPSTTTPATRHTGTGAGHSRGDNSHRGGRSGGKGGAHNPLWYVGYYDASSNENPWEGMEKFKGLAPVGTWVPRYWDRVAAASGGAGGGGDGGADGDGDDVDVGYAGGSGDAAGDEAGWDVGAEETGAGGEEEGAAVPAG